MRKLELLTGKAIDKDKAEESFNHIYELAINDRDIKLAPEMYEQSLNMYINRVDVCFIDMFDRLYTGNGYNIDSIYRPWKNV